MSRVLFIIILVFFICVNVGFTQDYIVKDTNISNVQHTEHSIDEIRQGDKVKANFLPFGKNNQTEQLIFTATILTLLCSTLLLLIMNQRKGRRISSLEEEMKMLSSKYATTKVLLARFTKKSISGAVHSQLFAGLPKGDFFQRSNVTTSVSDASYFVLDIIGNKQEEASFSVISDPAMQQTIIQHDLKTIEAICDFTNSPTNMTSIVVEEKGKVKKIGKVWKVMEKAKISFTA